MYCIVQRSSEPLCVDILYLYLSYVINEPSSSGGNLKASSFLRINLLPLYVHIYKYIYVIFLREREMNNLFFDPLLFKLCSLLGRFFNNYTNSSYFESELWPKEVGI